MAQTLYCWRCRRDAPLLDEREWAELAPLLSAMLSGIQAFRRETGRHWLKLSSKDSVTPPCCAISN